MHRVILTTSQRSILFIQRRTTRYYPRFTPLTSRTNNKLIFPRRRPLPPPSTTLRLLTLLLQKLILTLFHTIIINIISFVNFSFKIFWIFLEQILSWDLFFLRHGRISKINFSFCITIGILLLRIWRSISRLLRLSFFDSILYASSIRFFSPILQIFTKINNLHIVSEINIFLKNFSMITCSSRLFIIKSSRDPRMCKRLICSIPFIGYKLHYFHEKLFREFRKIFWEFPFNIRSFKKLNIFFSSHSTGIYGVSPQTI